MQAIAGSLSSAAAAASTNASIAGTLAGYERRKEEWVYQQSLAQQDLNIAHQQGVVAQDQANVVLQEQKGAQLQDDHAKATVEYLANKSLNADLYEWMCDVLGRVYSYFLRQATAVARLAQDQLAFERQQKPPDFIRSDYWQAASDTGEQGTLPNGSNSKDRLGLTGSARLLEDIYQLDQYAFETDKRKLQLSKTISLSRLAPEAFQRFRESGVLTFATPMELFDREFPGHYVRLIKRVRTSVVALVPSSQGIRATLSSSGISRVAVPDVGDFPTLTVRRDPQEVALSSPVNATGLFELDAQPEMLLPFEASGVDTSWELRMPKAANPFDYETIADVLFTVEYTALDSIDYRQQVVRQLDPTVSAERSFSLREDFADAWYDLHNPDQSNTPMTVRFRTGSEDFPPNVEKPAIEAILLYFSRRDSQTFEVPVSHLLFTPQGSTASVGDNQQTQSSDGIISTRRGNGTPWRPIVGKAPAGEWALALPNTQEVRNHFTADRSGGDVQDILLVITYKGTTPEWPA